MCDVVQMHGGGRGAVGAYKASLVASFILTFGGLGHYSDAFVQRSWIQNSAYMLSAKRILLSSSVETFEEERLR